MDIDKSPFPSAGKSSHSGKKLVQSRLSFKTEVKESPVTTKTKDVKGKLQYPSDDDDREENTIKNRDEKKTQARKRRKVSSAKDLRDNPSADQQNGDAGVESSSDSQDTLSTDMHPQKKARLNNENQGSNDQEMEGEGKEEGIQDELMDSEPRQEVTILSTTLSGSSDSPTDNDNEMNVSYSTGDNLTSRSPNPISIGGSANPRSQSKSQPRNLTEKQKKLMEIRRKARDDKELELQEKRRRKQQEKEARELAKKLEREEKNAVRRREQEEREQKRLAELEEKNEAKRKRHEAREAEMRKKNEERMRKEQEKEEAELKKKRAAEAFSKFFVNKAAVAGKELHRRRQQDDDLLEATLAFRPFQIKDDMKLAPINRVKLSESDKRQLDNYLFTKQESSGSLYLEELRAGHIIPRFSRTQVLDGGSMEEEANNSDDDVIVVEDEMNGLCQSITEGHNDTNHRRERFRAKFYKFHDNRRPPYYGTWRKRSKLIGSRRPFARDEEIFNYDIDSDEEWEEEEPGEALDDSDGDKENESEEDDYEVDNEWFVPHGHLSEEELQNAEEDGGGEDVDTPEAQKTKLKMLQLEFAQEMKKKTEKIKPRLIGCIWLDAQGEKPSECPQLIWERLCGLAMINSGQSPLTLEELERRAGDDGGATAYLSSSTGQTGSGKGEEVSVKDEGALHLSEEMLGRLVCLVHGNHHSKEFLIREFLAYLKQTHDLGEDFLQTSSGKRLRFQIRDKVTEMASWQMAYIHLELRPEQTIGATKGTNTSKRKKMACWVVNADVLKSLGLSELDLKNSWKYVLQPKPHTSLLNEDYDYVRLELCSSKEEQNARNVHNSPLPSNKGITAEEEATTTPTRPVGGNLLISQFLQKKDHRTSKVSSTTGQQDTPVVVSMDTDSDVILLD